MKKVVCPCGAEFKTHTEDEIVEHVSMHVKSAHRKDYPQGISRPEALKMVKEG